MGPQFRGLQFSLIPWGKREFFALIGLIFTAYSFSLALIFTLCYFTYCLIDLAALALSIYLLR